MDHEDEGILKLSDGRRLGYRAVGPPEGLPLFYFHGFPGARTEADLLCSEDDCPGWRVFALDRPGIGLSDFSPGRTLRDWPKDVEEFANAMGITRFSVVGVSGGGPYAAVCAWALPLRVRAAGIVCGLGPVDDHEGTLGMRTLNRKTLHVLRRLPGLTRPAFGSMAFFLKHFPLSLIDADLHSLPPRDQAAVKKPEVRRALESSFRESVRQGTAGGAHELKIYCQPWGFSPEAIRVPVLLWHGDRDTLAPSAMGRSLAKLIPGCRACFFPDEGHYSLLTGPRKSEILSTLLQASVTGVNPP
ncbi:MAG: alpha/beta hydrolase [Verrucomicrobiota bacterium]